MNSSFSLLEVIVAMLIFSIGVLGISKVNALVIQSMDASYLKHIAAIEICEKKI